MEDNIIPSYSDVDYRCNWQPYCEHNIVHSCQQYCLALPELIQTQRYCWQAGTKLPYQNCCILFSTTWTNLYNFCPPSNVVQCMSGRIFNLKIACNYHNETPFICEFNRDIDKVKLSGKSTNNADDYNKK